jgi:hypothetical protein
MDHSKLDSSSSNIDIESNCIDTESNRIDIESNSIDIESNRIDLSWIPENPEFKIDFIKSVEQEEIIEYIQDPNDVPTKLNEVTIQFISGKKMVLVLDQTCKLFSVKKWLNSYVVYYNDYYYTIDFVINSICVKNTIGMTLENISEITCIIRDRYVDIIIPAVCTNADHHHHHDNQYSIDCMGGLCDQNCGLLIPKGLNVYHLPENIPVEYADIYTDLEWVNFKEIVNSELDNYDRYSRQKTNRKLDNGDLCNCYKCDEYDCPWGVMLTPEECRRKYYSGLNFSRF